jgi:hypothetical protein
VQVTFTYLTIRLQVVEPPKNSVWLKWVKTHLECVFKICMTVVEVNYPAITYKLHNIDLLLRLIENHIGW